MPKTCAVGCSYHNMMLRKLSFRVITVFTVFRLLTDFVCLYTYEFLLSLCKIVRSSVILLLPLLIRKPRTNYYFVKQITTDKSLKLAIYIIGN